MTHSVHRITLDLCCVNGGGTVIVDPHPVPHQHQQETLSYRKHIARKLHTEYVDSIYGNSVTLKSRLRVIQGH